MQLAGATARGSAAAWDPTTGVLAVGGGDGKIRLLVPPAFEPSDEVSADGEVTVLAFSSDARLIAWGGPTGARVWDREKKDFATPFLPHAGPVATLAFSATVHSWRRPPATGWPGSFGYRAAEVRSPLPPVPHVLAEYGINHGGPDRVAPRFAAGDSTLLTVGQHDSAYFLHWRSATTGESLAMSKAQGHDFLGAFDVSPRGDRVAAVWDGDGLLWDAHKRMAVAAFRSVPSRGAKTRSSPQTASC